MHSGFYGTGFPPRCTTLARMAFNSSSLNQRKGTSSLGSRLPIRRSRTVESILTDTTHGVFYGRVRWAGMTRVFRADRLLQLEVEEPRPRPGHQSE